MHSSAVILNRFLTLSNTNLVASRHIEREKVSLPVDVRCSETSLLKLPNDVMVAQFVFLTAAICFLNLLTAAALTQSVECVTAEREVAGSIPGTGPILRVLK